MLLGYRLLLLLSINLLLAAADYPYFPEVASTDQDTATTELIEPGPTQTPHCTYDFSTPINLLPTLYPLTQTHSRATVILNQVFNTIEPNSMWTNSTSAAANTAAITISQPGKYILTGDLQINAQNSGAAEAGVIGIDITCSNVTLDLNGYTISQSAGSIASNITGVVGIRVKNISSSLANITIKNGHLNNLGNSNLFGTGLLIGEGTMTASTGTELATFLIQGDGYVNTPILSHGLQIVLLPGETLTMAGSVSTGTVTMNTSLTWLEPVA